MITLKYIILTILLTQQTEIQEFKVWILGGIVSTLLTILIILLKIYLNKQSNAFYSLELKLDRMDKTLNELSKRDAEKKVQIREHERRINKTQTDIKEVEQIIRKIRNYNQPNA